MLLFFIKFLHILAHGLRAICHMQVELIFLILLFKVLNVFGFPYYQFQPLLCPRLLACVDCSFGDQEIF